LVKCDKCDAEITEGASFCQQCGAPAIIASAGQKVIDLASWGDRIIAYIIDMILAGIILGIIKGIIFLPSFFVGSAVGVPRFVPWADWGFDNIFWFVYFLFMDLSYGGSIGKMVMKIKVTNLLGGQIDLRQAAIEAFGKAFLLPLDVILGWLFATEKSQRIFTLLAQTIVIKDDKRR
jgi:uncharacterized RDD family membrane protein YckC